MAESILGIRPQLRQPHQPRQSSESFRDTAAPCPVAAAAASWCPGTGLEPGRSLAVPYLAAPIRARESLAAGSCPTACGEPGEKMPLDVRQWTCLHCGAEHNRDINAANTIAAAGQVEAQNGPGARHQTGSPAAVRETSPRLNSEVQSCAAHEKESPAFRRGSKSTGRSRAGGQARAESNSLSGLRRSRPGRRPA